MGGWAWLVGQFKTFYQVCQFVLSMLYIGQWDELGRWVGTGQIARMLVVFEITAKLNLLVALI